MHISKGKMKGTEVETTGNCKSKERNNTTNTVGVHNEWKKRSCVSNKGRTKDGEKAGLAGEIYKKKYSAVSLCDQLINTSYQTW